MKKNDKVEVKVEVNVAKIVKYVCFAWVIIVGIIFGERAYEKYLGSSSRVD